VGKDAICGCRHKRCIVALHQINVVAGREVLLLRERIGGSEGELLRVNRHRQGGCLELEALEIGRGELLFARRRKYIENALDLRLIGAGLHGRGQIPDVVTLFERITAAALQRHRDFGRCAGRLRRELEARLGRLVAPVPGIRSMPTTPTRSMPLTTHPIFMACVRFRLYAAATRS
jgi:hypothetical protein